MVMDKLDEHVQEGCCSEKCLGMEPYKTTAVIKIERTGRVFSIASTEYTVTYPDGSKQESVWSPPWHDWDDEEEDARTLLWAAQKWVDQKEAEGIEAMAKMEEEWRREQVTS